MRKYNEKTNVVGNMIRAQRALKKCSQTRLCEKMELYGIVISKEDLSKIEHGKKTVKDFEVWGIAKALEISLDKLFEEINHETA